MDNKELVILAAKGSGGGSGGGGVMQVNATSGTSDKTLGELLTAYDAGTTIIVSYVSYTYGVTCKGTVIGTAGVYVDSKGLYEGSVTVARGIKEGNNLTPFLLAITPTDSEAAALASYPAIG